MGLGNNKDDTHGCANNNRIEVGIRARTEAGRNANNSGLQLKVVQVLVLVQVLALFY